ncbi:Agamous-like MADS-box protein AGL36 [Linum grandiflorum]
MGRKNVQLELITDEVARKTSFNKRKIRLRNKLSEISTLCGIMACGIIFYNFNGKGKNDQQKIETWPSGPETVDMLKKMKAVPLWKQKKYQLNHNSLLDESVEKLEQKLKNEIEKNKWLEMEWLLKCKDDDHLEEASSSGHKDLNDLANLKSKSKMVDELIRKVDKQIEYLKNETKNK